MRKRTVATEKATAIAEAEAAEARSAADRKATEAAVEEKRRLEAEAAFAQQQRIHEEATRRVADEQQAAAAARMRAAELDQAAADEEDLLRLAPTARQEYRLARRMLTALPHFDHLDPADPEHQEALQAALPLETISELLGVGSSQASVRRKAAMELLMRGYRGGGPLA